MAGAQLGLVGLCVIMSTFAVFLRALRWRVLLNSEGDVSVGPAFWATTAGYFGNNFLPARAGELIRTLMISSRYGLSKTFVFTTAMSERMVDAIVLVSVSAAVLLTLPARPAWIDTAVRPFAVLGACGVIAIAVLPLLEKFWRNVVTRLPVASWLREKLLHALEQILRGIRTFHKPAQLFGFLGLTVVIWMLDAFTTVVGAQALGIAITIPLAFLLIAGLGLGSALPSTPGYVGIYQFVAVSVLVPFGISRTAAIAFIIFYQVLQYVVITCWGFIAFWQFRRMPAPAMSPAP